MTDIDKYEATASILQNLAERALRMDGGVIDVAPYAEAIHAMYSDLEVNAEEEASN